MINMALCLCWGLSYAQPQPCINQFSILTTDWRVSPQTTGGAQVNTWDWTRDRFTGDVWIIENSVGNPPVCTDIPAPWHTTQMSNPATARIFRVVTSIVLKNKYNHLYMILLPFTWTACPARRDVVRVNATTITYLHL
jgi:hypothetical protein